MKRTKLRQVNRLDKRERILKAAIEVFAHRGFENSSVSDVANHAGVANGTVYLYFKNKVDMFVQAMQSVITERLAQIKQLIESDSDPAHRLIAFVEYHISLFTKNPDVLRFMVVEWRKSEVFRLENPNYNPFSDYLDYVTQLCDDCIKHGVFRPVNPRTLAFVIMGSMDFILTQWTTSSEEIDLVQIADEIRQILKLGVSEESGYSESTG